MGAKGKAAGAGSKATDAARAAGSNPYVQRLMEDEDLRDNLREAYEAARHAYSRMSNGKGPAKSLMEDKKVQRDLRKAMESLQEASEQLRGKKRGGGRLKKLFVVAIIGAGLALVLSEDARKAVLDKLFGSEEEFEYTSTTSPASETQPA